MNDYLRFVESIKDEIVIFREKQARSVKAMSERSVAPAFSPLVRLCCVDHQVSGRDVVFREDKLLKEWEDEKAADTMKMALQEGDADDGTHLTSLFLLGIHVSPY